MRITGGRYVRRRIDCPPGEIRPAMDRMRESIFSILGDLTGRSFLDVFSGSGIIGIEAASRGASPVLLIEGDPGKRATIRRNLSIVESHIELRIVSAEHFLATARGQFDLVFLDPPFRYADKPRLLQSIGKRGILAAGGRVLIHHPREDRLPDEAGGLVLVDSRSYGRSIVNFYSAGATGR